MTLWPSYQPGEDAWIFHEKEQARITLALGLPDQPAHRGEVDHDTAAGGKFGHGLSQA
jgi:hypothetical protein